MLIVNFVGVVRGFRGLTECVFTIVTICEILSWLSCYAFWA